MWLRELQIRNFRKIDALTVSFPHGLTVLVGENNSGKTTIIDALRLMLFSSRDLDSLRLTEDDFRAGTAHAPIEISCRFAGLEDEDEVGAALLRRRPNQSLRRRGRRQLDPSRRGEGAAEGTGGRWYLCRQRRLGVFRWYSRAWWRVSVRINAPAARGGLRTVATAAKCHRAPVDYHPVAGQMPTGLQ